MKEKQELQEEVKLLPGGHSGSHQKALTRQGQKTDHKEYKRLEQPEISVKGEYEGRSLQAATRSRTPLTYTDAHMAAHGSLTATGML